MLGAYNGCLRRSIISTCAISPNAPTTALFGSAVQRKESLWLQSKTTALFSIGRPVWLLQAPCRILPIAATLPAIQEVINPNAKEYSTESIVKGSIKAEAQIRAIFYPKFENEKSDQEVRMRMIDVVATGKGVFEVTLKHSGSLFMYSGDNGGSFAKNSYGNIYTAVGVFVLGRTLQEAWGEQAARKQREFNAFLRERRMCIAMELVTAVLGDHGQRPLKDYVVVTAVTELEGRPKFYSTADIVAFCRKWRLPVNNVWLFSSKKSVSAFFAAYDALCEEGTAEPVCKTLTEIADLYAPGTRSHSEVQGEILEGLVARIVSPRSTKRLQDVLQRIPPPPYKEGELQLGPGLREICAANRQNEQQQIKALLQAVGPNFCCDWSDWFGKNNSATPSTTLFSKFLQAAPGNYATLKLQEIIRLLRQRKMPVRFKCRSTASSGFDEQFKMVIHVLEDSVFRKYQKEMKSNPGLWPLYRGFFVDVVLHDDPYFANKQKSIFTRESSFVAPDQVEQDDTLADESEHLMLKLKFLTYKLRTFLIRNGLDILFTKGPYAYKEYYFRQMKIWGTSAEKQRELSQMLDEWAMYILKKVPTGRLNNSTYLSEAEPFLERYAKRSPQNQRLVGQAGTSVKVEDFIALVNEDEIKDEEGERYVLDENVANASQRTSFAGEDLKAKGMLIFFPGIPGCGKSAVAKEILNIEGALGGRPMRSLMGDLIKGKYWQKVIEERKRTPGVITFADKNAPTDEVWKQIENICQVTDAVAVPVVPDSDGTETNPYSLDVLATFIFRVLQRVNHPGNLDKNAPYPGYVMLMFYNLYEGKDRKEFEAALKRRFGHIVRMPVLKSERQPMPTAIRDALKEGLTLYRLHSTKHGKEEPLKGSFKNEWAMWEKKLKQVFFANSAYFSAIQVPFEETVKTVREQLEAVATGGFQIHIPISTTERAFRSFTYAALTLPVQDVISVLNKVSNSNKQVKEFFGDKQLQLKEAHVTLAHKRSHGIAAVAAYGDARGTKVPVELSALLFSQKNCAFEAHICSHNPNNIVSKNAWPHVTVWTAPDCQAKESNNLPELVTQGLAKRVNIEPVRLAGVMEFV